MNREYHEFRTRTFEEARNMGPHYRGFTYVPAFTETPPELQQQNTMTRISNQDWLLHENQDVLTAIGNPEITKIDVSPIENNEEYKQFGFNILTLNESRRPLHIPDEIGAQIRNNVRCSSTLAQVKIKIPNTRTHYVFAGKIYVPMFEQVLPDYIVEEHIQNIFLESVEHINETENPRNYNTTPLASIIKNIIWIHWDISERNSTNKAILRYILKKAGELINHEQFPRKKPENYEEEVFLKAIREFEDQKLEHIQEAIIINERQSEKGFREYQEAERELRKLKLTISAERATSDEIKKTAKETVEYFKDHKNVKSWEYRNGEMILILQNLKLKYNKEEINVPNPKIEINLRHGFFRAVSADPEYNINQIHPHIFPDGRACPGNFTTIFPKIVRDGKFIQILELLIQFFESFNDESPAIPFYRWRYLVKNHKTTLDDNEEDMKAAREYADYLETIGETDERTQSALQE